MDLIWIEIGVFKNFKECARSPCNGNHFSSIIVFDKYFIVYDKGGTVGVCGDCYNLASPPPSHFYFDFETPTS